VTRFAGVRISATFSTPANAAILFPEYNRDRAKYREAVQLAAQWICDELVSPGLAREAASEGKNITPLIANVRRSFSNTGLSNPQHVLLPIAQALAADKRVGIRNVGPAHRHSQGRTCPQPKMTKHPHDDFRPLGHYQPSG
jgi:hypothetical protein